MYLHAESVKVDSDEGRLTLEVDIGEIVSLDDESARLTVNIHGIDLDAFYDSVRSGIGGYLRERDEARRTVPVTLTGADTDWPQTVYDTSDPKHPDFHSIHADIHDLRGF